MTYLFDLSLALMSDLALDFGNTHIKAASFNHAELAEFRLFNNLPDLIKNKEFILKHKHVIIASVTNDHQHFMTLFGEKINCLLFSPSTPIPVVNSYKSISTLGSDRLAAAIGSYAIYPNKNVLTIDCGTCIKYNFMNSENQFLGGGISPGLNLRFRSLNDFTKQLPLIVIDNNFNKLIGENTEESIMSGVINGTMAEVDAMINEYKKKYADLIVVLSGGDADFFVKRLKNTIFAHPNIVLTGLHKILQFNFDKK